MSTRNQRRVLRKETPRSGEAQLMHQLVAGMADCGPQVMQSLHDAVGGQPNAGHAVDALMNAAARMEKDALMNDPESFVQAVAQVLFLARHVAISQGKITVEQPAQA